MSNIFNDSRNKRDRTPLFFKIWFGFVLTGVLCVFALVAFNFYQFYTCPECVGARVGSFAKGALDASGVKELLKGQ